MSPVPTFVIFTSRPRQDPVIHISVASMLGDVSSYVGSSRDGVGHLAVEGLSRENVKGANSEGRHGEGKSSADGEGLPPAVCLPVEMVACKAGTTIFEAPLIGHL